MWHINEKPKLCPCPKELGRKCCYRLDPCDFVAPELGKGPAGLLITHPLGALGGFGANHFTRYIC